MWHVCVPLHRLQSWLPSCPLVRKNWIWEGFYDSCAMFLLVANTKLDTWLVILCGPLGLLYSAECFAYWAHNWRLWALSALSCMGGHLRAGISSNCLPFLIASSESLNGDSQLVVRAGKVSFTWHFNASGRCILFLLHPKTSSSSGFGFAHCKVRDRYMHINLVSCAGMRCYHSVCPWW